MRECLNQCADEHLHYCRRQQGPSDHPGWRDALAHLFHTTGTQDPRLSLIHPTRAEQDARTGPQVTSDGLHLHVGGYRRQGSLSPPTQGAGIPPTGGPPVHPPQRTRGRRAQGTERGCGVARVSTPTALRANAGVVGDHGRPVRPGNGASAAPG